MQGRLPRMEYLFLLKCTTKNVTTINDQRQFFLGAGFGGPFSAMDLGPGGVAGGRSPKINPITRETDPKIVQSGRFSVRPQTYGTLSTILHAKLNVAIFYA